VRAAYFIAGLIVAALVIFNVPRLPWIHTDEAGPIGPFRGFVHGMIGFSYVGAWLLTIAGIYQLILGIVYWDMDTTEQDRWQFTMETGGTARLLWITGGVTLLLGLLWGWYILRNDHFLWPCGLASSIGALLVCWLLWLAFPLMEQVGIDREQMGV
jgi:hypothetical protein